MKFKTIIFTSLLGVMLTAFAVLVHRSSAITPAEENKITDGSNQAPSIAQVPTASADQDSDGDGLTDANEIHIYHTDPNNQDTDHDGYNDGLEIKAGYSPLVPKLKLNQVDTDRDGLSDDVEIKLGTNLAVSDTNGDGHSDLEDIQLGLSPTANKNLPIEKRIEVNVKDYNLKYFVNNVALDSVPVSTGMKSWPTPRGEFSVLNKVPERDFGGRPYAFSYPNTKWNLEFATKTTNNLKLKYYIHGAYWHDEFGKKNVSSGCVNVAYKNMEPLYKFASLGTKVIIR